MGKFEPDHDRSRRGRGDDRAFGRLPPDSGIRSSRRYTKAEVNEMIQKPLQKRQVVLKKWVNWEKQKIQRKKG